MINEIEFKNKYYKSIAGKEKAFSLIEVLVASSIFAVILLIATGVFGMGGNYNSKMREMRRVGEGSRKLADMITESVRSANTSGKIIYHPSSGSAVDYNFKNGIAMMNCLPSGTGVLCKLVGNTNPQNATLSSNSNERNDATIANVLILFNKNWTRVYYSEYSAIFGGSTPNGYNLFYREYSGSKTFDCYELASTSNTIYADLSSQSNTYNINQMVTGTVGEARVLFNGFTPDDNHATLQPYVNMDIVVRSATDRANYDGLANSKYDRALAEIVTTVTSRSYNQ